MGFKDRGRLDEALIIRKELKPRVHEGEKERGLAGPAGPRNNDRLAVPDRAGPVDKEVPINFQKLKEGVSHQ